MSYYLVEGGDGFDMLKGPGVTELTESENGLWLIDIVRQFFSRTSTAYEPKPGTKARREARFKLFNVDEQGLSPDGKWLMVNPKISGRIQTV